MGSTSVFSVSSARAATRRLLPGLLPAALLALLSPSPAAAAGFAVYEQSPQGTALAGAMTARADDASTIFYNPAGLGFLPGVSAVAGVTVITAQSTATQFTGGANAAGTTYSSLRGNFFLPTAYVSARVLDVLSVGVGAFASHGLGLDWGNSANPGSFPGRFLAESANLQTFTINPTVALRPLKELSIGAGLDVMQSSVALGRSLALGQDAAQISIAAGTTSIGGNFGAMASLLRGRLSLGVSYRMEMSMNYSGGKLGYVPPPGVSAPFPYNQAGTQLFVPHTIAVGVGVAPLRWLKLSADMVAMLWSDTQNLTLTLTDTTGKAPQQVAVTPRGWRNAYSGRLGVEADISQMASLPGRLVPKVRLGFGYDQTPVPTTTIDPSLPDSDRFLVTLGLSMGLRGLGAIEAGYMAVLAQQVTSQNPDLGLTYSTTAHVISVALVLQVDGKVLRGRGQHAGPLYYPEPR